MGEARHRHASVQHSEAARAVIDAAFRNPAMQRVGAVCDVESRVAARVLEKAGMAREGTSRRGIVHPAAGSEPRDCLVYARIR